MRYYSLIHIPYFDFISFVVIHPMHNLMLGTTKKMLKIWKEENLLSEKEFSHLQSRIIKLKVPSSIGQILSKIASNFKGFTADQFKNWAVVFSTFALKGILPDRHVQCWKLFVKACRILCSTVIPTSQVKLADELLVKFVKLLRICMAHLSSHRTCIFTVICVNVSLIMVLYMASGVFHLSAIMES